MTAPNPPADLIDRLEKAAERQEAHLVTMTREHAEQFNYSREAEDAQLALWREQAAVAINFRDLRDAITALKSQAERNHGASHDAD